MTYAAPDRHCSAPGCAAIRSQVKASRLFSSAWDLVDALEDEKVKLAELEESELPRQLRQMSPEERVLYVEEIRMRREELRRRIAELGAKRRQYVAERMKTEGLDDSRAFDTVVRRALREKVQEKGFQVSER